MDIYLLKQLAVYFEYLSESKSSSITNSRVATQTNRLRTLDFSSTVNLLCRLRMQFSLLEITTLRVSLGIQAIRV